MAPIRRSSGSRPASAGSGEEIMTARQRPIGGKIRAHAALGVAVIIAAFALPVVAQTPAGIPGVLAPGSVPELVQEGYVFTEGPVANRDGSIAVLTEGPPGAPLLAPNDLIVDAKGGIYFTDPGPRPVVPGRPTYVYYLPAGAK